MIPLFTELCTSMHGWYLSLRHCRRQFKILASAIDFSKKNIFSRSSSTQISGSLMNLCLFFPEMPKLQIMIMISNAFTLLYCAWTMLQITHFCSVKIFAWKSGNVLTNIMFASMCSRYTGRRAEMQHFVFLRHRQLEACLVLPAEQSRTYIASLPKRHLQNEKKTCYLVLPRSTKVRKKEGQDPKWKWSKMAECFSVACYVGHQPGGSYRTLGFSFEYLYCFFFQFHLGIKSAAGFIAAPAIGPKAKPSQITHVKF